MSAGRSIADLRYHDDFVRALPGDPSAANVQRAVLGAGYSRVTPTPVSAPRLVALVPEVADLLDLAHESTPELVEVLAGNRVLPGMEPYAACYGGHQFGTWAGQLGDGRALTLGEVRNDRGETWEMQLKGAGPTPYSRRADGRAVLRSSLRELVCSEAMFHLGVPTTRALSLVLTGDTVVRDLLYDGHPEAEPGAIVCRVAPSFLRFGNFEIHAARGDVELLRRVTEFAIARWFPGRSIAEFFTEVCRSTAQLVVQWMRVGFVHGVLNTDNMSILGLTIDYGPYGWMEPFDPDWTPNITDASGRRYRFANQPGVAQWNLSRLAGALLPLVGDAGALEDGLRAYEEEFVRGQREMMRGKLGLEPGDDERDDGLFERLFELLAEVETDMTLFFRRLADVPDDADAEARMMVLREAFYAPERIGVAHAGLMNAWLDEWLARARAGGVDAKTRHQRMNARNPLYVPRNYLVQQVIDRVQAGEVEALAELMNVLRRPYDEQPGREAFAAKRPEWARHKPGCSMLSCSS